MIYNRWWETLADTHFKSGDQCPPSGIVCCDLSIIPELFSIISKSSNQYIIISPNTDWILCLQEQHNPGKDIGKLANVACVSKHGYTGVQLPPTVNPQCNPSHKYSIKCYRYTQNTFDNIPNNVHKWFLVNNLVPDDRLISIPFGIDACGLNFTKRDRLLELEVPSWNQRKLNIYLNCQYNYTYERKLLYEFYNIPPYKNMVTVEYNIQWENYIQSIMKHKFVLCPNGNGIDCFRTLEVLYLGAIPIVEDSHNARNLAQQGFPVLIHPTLKLSTWDFQYICNTKLQFNNHITLTTDFWKDKIQQAKADM